MSSKSLLARLLFSSTGAGVLLILILLSAQVSKTQAASAVVDDDEDEDEEEERRFDRAAMEEEDDEPPTPPPPRGAKDKGSSSKIKGTKSVDFDEEEFEGFQEPVSPPPANPKGQKGPTQEEKLKAQKIVRQMRKPKELKDFYPEMGACVMILLYGLNYIYGWMKNKGIATKYLAICTDILEENFALIGIEGSKKFVSESANQYKLYLSGRLNCESVQITLDLKPRQDMLSLVWDFFKPFAEDLVTIEVFTGQTAETGGSMEKFCMAVMPKNDETKARENNKDLEIATTRKWKTGLHDSLICMSDEEEVPRDLLTDAVVEAINNHKQYVKLMHFSDRMMVGVGSGRRPTNCLKTVHKLLPSDRQPGVGEKSQTDKLQVAELYLRIAFRYIDRVTTYTLSNAARERLKKVQASIAEMEFKKTRARREAEARQRKLDKALKEKEAMEGRSEAEQAKYEEKMRKKQMKKTVAGKVMKMK